MRPLGIVLHISASKWGDAKEVEAWHRARGFDGIGYHGVILNGYRKSNLKYTAALNGKIEPGRADHLKGAHCKAAGMNACTLGVSLIGLPGFAVREAEQPPADLLLYPYATERQLMSLIHWIRTKCEKYDMDPNGTFKHPVTGKRHPVVTQHSDHDPGKPLCASWRLDELRKML